jgi:hypothetical protein
MSPDFIRSFFERNASLEPAAVPVLPAVIQELLSKPISWFKENPSNANLGTAPLTNIAFVLDCSTSMSEDKATTVDGFNAQVEVIREGAKSAGATTYTDVHFSTEVHLRCVAGSLEELKPLTAREYKTNGWTSLYDALGATVAALLGTPGINDSQTATLVTVFTDGDENRSRLYDGPTLRAVVERLEATGRWTFALVGPFESVTGLAKILSVNPRNIAGFDVSSGASKVQAFDKVASASANYMTMRSSGATQSSSLYDDKDLTT